MILKATLPERVNMLSTRDVEFHVEVEASQEAYKRMEEHELLYTQGIAESEKWFNFVESLARTCKNCKYCLVHKGMFSNFRICNNSESKYGGDFIHKYWTCDSFERKGE